MNLAVLIALVSGAVGGNFAGGVLKSLNLGLLGNSIFGAMGGYTGLRIAEAVLGVIHTNNNHVDRDGANTSVVITAIGAGLIGGAVLVILIGAARHHMNR